MYIEEEDVVYLGQTIAGNMRNGLGLQIYRNGSIYEGSFFSGKKHGRGR